MRALPPSPRRRGRGPELSCTEHPPKCGEVPKRRSNAPLTLPPPPPPSQIGPLHWSPRNFWDLLLLMPPPPPLPRVQPPPPPEPPPPPPSPSSNAGGSLSQGVWNIF